VVLPGRSFAGAVYEQKENSGHFWEIVLCSINTLHNDPTLHIHPLFLRGYFSCISL